MHEADFALFNVDRVLTMAPGSHPAAQGPLGVLRRAAVAADRGKIVWVGPMAEFDREVRMRPEGVLMNTHGRVALPGFVDAYTAPVQESGGRPNAVGDESDDPLVSAAFDRCDTFLRYGTTCMGAVTGSVQSCTDALRTLRVLNRLQRLSPLKIVPILSLKSSVAGCLAEAREFAEIVEVTVAKSEADGDGARDALTQARSLGFNVLLRGDGVGRMGWDDLLSLAAPLAIVLPDSGTPADMPSLRSGSLRLLLPGRGFAQRGETTEVGTVPLDAGQDVALGTGYEPTGASTQSMQFVVALAVLRLGMAPEQALLAATMGAARALGLQSSVGSIQPGKYCDLVTYAVEDEREIAYRYGMNLVDTTVVSGRVVYRSGEVVAGTRLALNTG